jgi:hypothetical protein
MTHVFLWVGLPGDQSWDKPMERQPRPSPPPSSTRRLLSPLLPPAFPLLPPLLLPRHPDPSDPVRCPCVRLRRRPCHLPPPGPAATSTLTQGATTAALLCPSPSQSVPPNPISPTSSCARTWGHVSDFSFFIRST